MATATQTKKKTQIRPLDDRVWVEPDEPEEKTESGIYLPEQAKERPQTGQVLAVGPGKLNDDGSRTQPSVKEGDKVVFGKYAGTEVELDGEEQKLVRESELLAVLEG
jgi:chaperonin GroES